MNQKNQTLKNDKTKCKCVPSGLCHSHMLLGCPHDHFWKDNQYMCKNNLSSFNNEQNSG